MKYNTPFAGSGEHMLDDLDTGVVLVQANQALRFSNSLVDRMLLYVIWTFFGNALLAKIFIGFGFYVESRFAARGISYLLAELVATIYFTGFEYYSGGKTPGKWVTGTRAVLEDGHKLNFKGALLRSLYRVIPIEVFTALGKPCYPWHDRWAKTLVVVEKESVLPMAGVV